MLDFTNERVIDLGTRRIGASTRLTRAVIENAQYISVEDMIMDQFIYQIDAFVTVLEGKGVLQVPATWWDAFKERWFPAWLRFRYPVQYMRYRAVQYLPNFPLPPRMTQGAVATFEKLTEEEQ